MSSVVIAGDTSGTVTLAAPAVAGSTTLTLPASTGMVALNQSTLFSSKILAVEHSNNSKRFIYFPRYERVINFFERLFFYQNRTIIYENFYSNCVL